MDCEYKYCIWQKTVSQQNHIASHNHKGVKEFNYEYSILKTNYNIVGYQEFITMMSYTLQSEGMSSNQPEQTNCILLGAVSIRKTVLPGMAIPMLKIRRPNGRLIFNMEITIRR